MSTFSGLSVALSSLQAQRRAMDVIAQNVSNVNTPGYTRQRAELRAIAPANTLNIWGNVAKTGDGVYVETVTRMTDQVTLNRLRGHEADAGYLSTMAATMSTIEKGLGEPSDTGLTEQLASMFSAWGDVSNSPDSAASVGVALQKAVAVADTVRSGYENLTERWDGLRARVTDTLSDVNAAAKSIAALNQEIFRASVAGAPANELKDQRDHLLTKLSGIAGMEIASADAPAPSPEMVKVSFNGVTLVNGQTVLGDLAATGGTTLPSQIGLSLVAADGSGSTVVFDPASGAATPTGRLGADLESLNRTIPDVAAGYDEVAARLTQLMADNSNPGFFTGTPRDLRVAITDPTAVVTSTPGTRDGAIADAIVAMRSNATGPAEAWRKLVGTTGGVSQSYTTRATASESNRLAAESALSSATGVDIDEEMTNLVATQRAYEAAGKLLATIDSLLDTLINRMGR